MKLIRYNPFTLSPRRLFGDAPSLFRDFDSFIDQGSFMPAVDVFEEGGNIRVKADLPGMNDQDVKVEVKDHYLTITGEKKEEKKEEKKGYHYSERTFGSFSRSIRLPESADTEKISATYKDGVLDIEIPQLEEKKPTRIAIKS